MRNRNQAIIITTLSILLLVVIAFASGVRMTPNTAKRGTQQSRILPGTPTVPRSMVNPTQTKAPITKPVLTSSQKLAEKINTEVRKMKGVLDSSTVVAGDTALIGCKFSKDIKNAALEKKTIEKRVKAANKSIKKCVVTDSAATMAKISKLFKSTNTTNIGTQINDLIRTITPTTKTPAKTR
ncbi:MAG: YhcN/YlaJ family sporulation lipoprotein [Ignavibacteriales bacterium]